MTQTSWYLFQEPTPALLGKTRMSDHEKQHNLDNEREQNISESFWVFSVSGTGGKAIPGTEIKEIQFLGVDYTRQKWDKNGIYSINKPFPNLIFAAFAQDPLIKKLLYNYMFQNITTC